MFPHASTYLRHIALPVVADLLDHFANTGADVRLTSFFVVGFTALLAGAILYHVSTRQLVSHPPYDLPMHTIRSPDQTSRNTGCIGRVLVCGGAALCQLAAGSYWAEAHLWTGAGWWCGAGAIVFGGAYAAALSTLVVAGLVELLQHYASAHPVMEEAFGQE